MTDANQESKTNAEDLYGGIRMVDFFALTDAEHKRRAEQMMRDDPGFMVVGPEHHLNELNRRTTDRYTRQLVILTWVIAALTFVLAVSEVLTLIREGL